ncbi:MAG TPA: hypothetical protein ENK07_02440, partial [Bacteroidetes bacterium]|nr:hypothetical protein [Bacteroidota bacterium]
MPTIWTWMHPRVDESDRVLEKNLRRLKEGGVDGLFLLVYDGHRAFYESAVLPAEKDELSRVLAIAR